MSAAMMDIFTRALKTEVGRSQIASPSLPPLNENSQNEVRSVGRTRARAKKSASTPRTGSHDMQHNSVKKFAHIFINYIR